MKGSLKIGRFAGIDVGVHYTWLIAFALITWSLATGFFPMMFPGWATATYWLTGAIAAVALFVSVLVHELSHSFMALARGLRVRNISLFIFGGVSNIEGEPDSPGSEFLITIVGPLTSLLIAALLWAIAQVVDLGSGPTAAVVGYLILINLLLAIFNLLPGFPLDGGRVLRALIWGITGSLHRATQIASYVGQALGFLLIFWGVWQIFSGNFLGGLWIAFIGWFLNNAAESARQQQVLTEALAGVTVADLMNPNPPTAEPSLSLQEFMMGHVLRRGQRAVLVMDGNQLAGIISISDVRDVPQEEWPSTPVANVMTHAPLKTTTPDTDLNVVLTHMVEGDVNQLPVVHQDRVVGLISRSDVLRYLQFHHDWGTVGRLRERPVTMRPQAPATHR